MQDTPGKPTPVTGATLEEKCANAKAQLDRHFVETVQWHFNPETGTTTQGRTFKQALANLKEATALYLSEFPIKTRGRAVMTTFEVAPAHA